MTDEEHAAYIKGLTAELAKRLTPEQAEAQADALRSRLAEANQDWWLFLEEEENS